MSYREYVPAPALRPFVDRLWTRDGGLSPSEQRVLPDGCIDWLLHLGTAPRAVVVGTMTRPHVVPAGFAPPIVAVRFRPGGAAAFLRERADRFTDHHVALDDAGVSSIAILDRVLDEVLPHRRARALERHLLAALPRAEGPPAIIDRAVGALWREQPPSVDALARELGVTRQHLRRLFRDHVGIGPKELARVARVHRAIERLGSARRGDLAGVATEIGFFDQAHMNRDFREIAGATPGEIIRRDSIFPIRPAFDEAG